MHGLGPTAKTVSSYLYIRDRCCRDCICQGLAEGWPLLVTQHLKTSDLLRTPDAHWADVYAASLIVWIFNWISCMAPDPLFSLPHTMHSFCSPDLPAWQQHSREGDVQNMCPVGRHQSRLIDWEHRSLRNC